MTVLMPPSTMNSAVVVSVDTLDKVNAVVERGIVLINTHVGVFYPLVNPTKKGILSNLPPFISNEALFLNCAVDDLDRNHLEPNLQSRKFLKIIIGTYELSDVWRSQHGNCRRYSWSHARDNYITLARLDHF